MKWFTCEEKNVNDDSTKLAIERERESCLKFFFILVRLEEQCLLTSCQIKEYSRKSRHDNKDFVRGTNCEFQSFCIAAFVVINYRTSKFLT